jgi:hypothetical protein
VGAVPADLRPAGADAVTGLDRLLDNLPVGSPPPASADLQRAIGLFNRMASYLDKTRPV